jgi:hypothetical protein
VKSKERKNLNKKEKKNNNMLYKMKIEKDRKKGERNEGKKRKDRGGKGRE